MMAVSTGATTGGGSEQAGPGEGPAGCEGAEDQRIGVHGALLSKRESTNSGKGTGWRRKETGQRKRPGDAEEADEGR